CLSFVDVLIYVRQMYVSLTQYIKGMFYFRNCWNFRELALDIYTSSRPCNGFEIPSRPAIVSGAQNKDFFFWTVFRIEQSSQRLVCIFGKGPYLARAFSSFSLGTVFQFHKGLRKVAMQH